MGVQHGEQVVVGVDIGGTTMTIARVHPDGVVDAAVQMPSPARVDGSAVVGEIRRVVLSRWPDVTRIGVGTAGVICPRTGAVLAASDSFRGWAGFPLRQELEDALGVPVRVENDVNAFLLGEQRFGAAAGHDDCLGIMLGTGVGGAVVLGGAIHAGVRGAAAEIGHMPVVGDDPCSCGTAGHLESRAGGRAIARRYASLRGSGEAADASARSVALAADDGDADARRVLSEAGTALGLAMVQAATLYDLTTVVVGGGVAQSWHLIGPAVDAVIARYPLISGAELEVSTAELGGHAVLVGAASLAAAEGWRSVLC